MRALPGARRACCRRSSAAPRSSAARRACAFCPTASPSPGSRATSRRRCSARPASSEGDAKCTYGTGAFALMNIGRRARSSASTAWSRPPRGASAAHDLRPRGQRLHRGRGGAVAARRARHHPEREGRRGSRAQGAVERRRRLRAGPRRPRARRTGTRRRAACITGLTRGTTAAHLARATLEGIAFEVRDLLDAMARDAKRPLRRLRVDGGAAANDLLMQFQADLAESSSSAPPTSSRPAAGAACSPASAPASTHSLHEVARTWPWPAGSKQMGSRARPLGPLAERAAADQERLGLSCCHPERSESALPRVRGHPSACGAQACDCRGRAGTPSSAGPSSSPSRRRT